MTHEELGLDERVREDLVHTRGGLRTLVCIVATLALIYAVAGVVLIIL